MNNNIKELLVYLKNYKTNLFIVFLALFVVAMSLLQMGNIFRNLVDDGLSTNTLNAINNSIFLISILIIIFAIGSFFRSYFINLITEKIISKIKLDTYNNLLKIEIAEFEELKIGDIISRLSSDLELVGTLITNFLSFFVRNSIMLIGAIILMFYQSQKLSTLVIITIPVLLMPLLRLSKHVRGISKKLMVEKSSLASFIEESFSGIRTLYAFNQQHYISEQFNEKINIYIKHSSKRLKLRSLFFAFAIIFISGSITMVIWVGSIDIIEGQMTSGQMLSFIYYAIIVGMSSGGIAELFSEMHVPLAALERVFELKNICILQDQKILASNNNYEFDSYNISFKSINFSYPSRSDILALNDISFDIKQNQFTAIVGKSGSGKSTIMQLLLGFYQHQSGQIKIGNKIITSNDAINVRNMVAYVEQDPTIFSGTIRFNILFSNPNATEQELSNVIKLCSIDSFTENGIDTEIGEKGIRISGGQKQRIAIARALLYKPEILLLDEATSALDSQSEEEILSNIKKFMKDKTIISIAHRTSSIQNADKILVIDHGKLVNSGTHQELLEISDIYFALHTKSII